MTTWHQHEVGTGEVRRGADDAFTLRLSPDEARRYSNAQITDYAVTTMAFRAQPPLRMSLRARFAQPAAMMVGTAGFGFWNHALEPGSRRVRLPQALWFFFGAPPNDMPLAADVPGHGWKAATFNAQKPLFYGLVPLALPGFGLMRVPALKRRLWPLGQRALGVHEAALDQTLLTEDHAYTLEWRPEGARFAVDGVTVLETEDVPAGPLGFIAWIDNQYAIVKPTGDFRFGVSGLARQQALMLRGLRLERW